MGEGAVADDAVAAYDGGMSEPTKKTRTEELLAKLGEWGMTNAEKEETRLFVMRMIQRGDRRALDAAKLMLEMDRNTMERVKMEDQMKRLDDRTPTAIVGVDGLEDELNDLLGGVPKRIRNQAADSGI